MALNDLDVVYDDKAFGNIIDPTQWNANFKLIETITNANNVIVNGHLVNFVNPHQVTKIQVGLANVDDVKQATKAEFDTFVARTDNPHAVTKGQVGLSNLTNNAQATKIEFDLHTARTDNPHTVTAAQVNAYTKAEMQTTGQAALHWGNLTNVPNMADASWKSAVATPANLPITGNTLLDQRIVLNDGDGKQAMYSCVATTGDWDAQWDKIADVDFAGDEATRVTQENARVSAEGGRVTAEGLRVTADSDRTTAEGGRVTAESGRVNAESSRITIENGRVSTEGLRVTAEGLRATAEGNRVNAEGLRVTADGNRTTAEGLRTTAEVNRVTAENARVTADAARAFIGVYSGSTNYIKGNQVTFLGSTYRCILASIGNEPTNGTYWILVAQKGADGLGSGDMLKTTYDTNNNGVVDNAEKVNGFTVNKSVPADALFTDTIPDITVLAPKISPIFQNDVTIGTRTGATGINSFSQGSNNEASGINSHAEGNQTTASGDAAHAEGYGTAASGAQSHSQNLYTIAKGVAQTALGKYNVSDTTSAVIVGNGTAEASRSNALTMDWSGNLNIAGVLREAAPKTATITTVWTGTSAPYTQVVNVVGITALDIPLISAIYSTNNATAILEKAAWNSIGTAITGVDNIIFTCFEDKPVTAINIQIKGA